MKLVSSSNGFKSLSRPKLSKLFRVLFYSTETLTPSHKPKNSSLYRRISRLGDPRVSIVPVLEKWIEEGKNVRQDELNSMIKQLRKFRRFNHALEVSQWMSDRRHFPLSRGDVAVRLDLISKVHGIEQAEKYFDNIPMQFKVFQVYNTFLNCYAHWKSVEKAEALIQKMRELGFARTSLAHNILLNLYSQVGQYEKLDTLMEKMNEMGIRPDKFTFSIRLTAYATTSNIDGMENILQRMKEDPEIIMDWNCYAIAANGYIKAGQIDKALEMLKKSEELITGKKRMMAYHYLLTLYAGIGRKDELYRIWNLYKSLEKVKNAAYLCMISSLLKFDDITGAEKILKDWESGGTSYDFRVPNLVIAASCNNGLVDKAEKIINKAVEKGQKPYASSWNHLATGYIKANQIPKALEAMKAAILVRRPGWKPSRDTLAACLLYLKDQGDDKGAEEFVRLLGAPDHHSIDDCEKLLDYIYDEKPESGTANEMDEDGMDDTEETDEMSGMKLESVS